MFLDGLEDAYDKGRLMGTFAEDCATEFQFTRADQDAYALASLARAREAQASGAFAAEIAAVTVTTRNGAAEVAEDEQPKTARPEKIPTLKPAFRKDGTVTPANSSSISDGAAALVLMRESDARARGLPIRARVLGHATHAQAPARFPTAPVPAAESSCSASAGPSPTSTSGRSTRPSRWCRWPSWPRPAPQHDRLNVHGGACALGHPIGASGARILVTLLHALERHDRSHRARGDLHRRRRGHRRRPGARLMRPGPDTPAVVSGGASGLGAATARALARRGARVTILDLDADRGAEAGGRDPRPLLRRRRHRPRRGGRGPRPRRRRRTGRRGSPSPAPASPRRAHASTATGGRTTRACSRG